MRRFILAFSIVSIGACASSGGGTGMTSEPASGETRQVNTYLITEQEIKAQSFTNAWQAIIALRPTWPKTTPAFVKNGRMAFERLQEVPIAEVKEIQYLTRDRARVRFGPDAQETIVIVSK